PQPDGPTKATNSPRRMSSDNSRSTSKVPNERETLFSCKALLFIIGQLQTKTTHPRSSNRRVQSGSFNDLFHLKSSFSRFVNSPRLAGRLTSLFARKSRYLRFDKFPSGSGNADNWVFLTARSVRFARRPSGSGSDVN